MNTEAIELTDSARKSLLAGLNKGDDQAYGDYFELLLHRILTKIGCDVSIYDPSLLRRYKGRIRNIDVIKVENAEIHGSGPRPDFLILEGDQRCFVEAAVVNAKSLPELSNEKQQQLIDRLNKLTHPSFRLRLQMNSNCITALNQKTMKSLLEKAKNFLGRYDLYDVKQYLRENGNTPYEKLADGCYIHLLVSEEECIDVYATDFGWSERGYSKSQMLACGAAHGWGRSSILSGYRDVSYEEDAYGEDEMVRHVQDEISGYAAQENVGGGWVDFRPFQRALRMKTRNYEGEYPYIIATLIRHPLTNVVDALYGNEALIGRTYFDTIGNHRRIQDESFERVPGGFWYHRPPKGAGGRQNTRVTAVLAVHGSFPWPTSSQTVRLYLNPFVDSTCVPKAMYRLPHVGMIGGQLQTYESEVANMGWLSQIHDDIVGTTLP